MKKILLNNVEYHLDDVYHVGGTSVIYNAFIHTGTLKRNVLVKAFEYSENTELIKKLYKQELESLNLLHSSNVTNALPEIYNYGSVDRNLYIVLEKFSGNKLSDLLKKNLCHNEKLDYMIKITQLVKHLNDLDPNVVHMDLKPSNFIVDELENMYLVDLGSLYIKGHPWVANFTETYASPEVRYNRIEHVDHHSDIYSLGCMFYEIINEKVPNLDDLLFLDDYCEEPLINSLLLNMLENDAKKRIVDYNQIVATIEKAKSGIA